MKNTCRLLMVLVVLLSGTTLCQTWNAVGPYGGWINDLTKDVSGNIYAGTYVGGIFKSSNNGDTWVQIYNDTLIIDPQSVALNSSGHIFIGTPQQGFFRSTNGGTSWQKMNNNLNTRNVVALLVLSNDNILAGCWPGGVHRSTDNGTTFTTINTGLTNTDVRFVGVKPTNGYLFAATDGGGMFRSTDGGASWSAVNNGITANAQMNWVGVNPAGDIYANGPSLYRSTDNGDNWTNLTSAISAFQTDIAFAPNAMYAASGNRVRKSTDGGATWTQETGVPDMIFVSIVVSGNTIIAGSGGLGTYRSNGTGSPTDTWTQVVSGMRNTHIVGIDEAPNGDLFAATLLAGVFRSTDQGLSWFSASGGIPPSNRLSGLAVSPATGTVFVGSEGSSGYRSTDRGATWTSVGNLSSVTAVACNSQGHVFGGAGSFVRRSTNDGVTWTFSEPSFQISKIADFAFDRDTVYVATGVGSGSGTSRGVYRSTNNGNTWSTENAGLTDLNIVSVTVAESLTTSGSQPFSCFRVACATRNGNVNYYNPTASNSAVSWGSGFVSPVQIIEIRQKLNRLIIAGTKQLRQLIDLDCGHDNEINRLAAEITRLEAIRDGLTLIIGTYGYGIWRGIIGPVAVAEKRESPLESVLAQNYPNPFNPNTKIKYQIPNASMVTLTVFDVLGREVAMLVNETRESGEYSVTLDASHLSSGVYFYRLHTSGFTQTKRLVLLR